MCSFTCMARDLRLFNIYGHLTFIYHPVLALCSKQYDFHHSKVFRRENIALRIFLVTSQAAFVLFYELQEKKKKKTGRVREFRARCFWKIVNFGSGTSNSIFHLDTPRHPVFDYYLIITALSYMSFIPYIYTNICDLETHSNNKQLALSWSESWWIQRLSWKHWA